LDQEFVMAPGVYDALSARVAVDVGFDVLYMTGFGTAASLGMPDVGLVTMSEMVGNLSRIVDATGAAVLADADTGYGNPLNVARTVRSYERAGASGLHLEDQVFPKKCGFFEGKQVIPTEEHVQKLKAACDSRRDESFVIIGRTDALATGGWSDTVDRAGRYREAGADLVFVDGIRTEADLQAYKANIVDVGLPALYNGMLVSPTAARDLGFAIQIAAGAALFSAFGAIWKVLGILAHGSADMQAQISAEMRGPHPDLTDVLGLPLVYESEERYKARAAGLVAT
jgi:2-methylisocitrate lyase-like PEP mutase family enzyme